MIAWILKDSGFDCTAFLGGICLNFNSNFVQGNNAVMVVEADEFDRSFHTLHPNLAVITAIDDDHLEIYGTKAELEKNFLAFANHIQEEGTLLYKREVHAMDEYAGKKLTYSFHQKKGDVYVESYHIESGVSEVTLSNGFTFRLQYPGLHNIENATAAAAIAIELGISAEKIVRALYSFKGIHRRFEIVYNDGDTVLIDDYAHHPEEIRMFLKSVRALYANKKVTVVFQPHLFTRTRDLAIEFAASLDLADNIALLPVYPARELPIEGVDSSLISGRMQQPVELIHPHQVQTFVQEHAQSVICLLGAGDIDRLVAPIAQFLTQNKSL
jgi:UDP-N-acetylmuramate--alanine ligase